MSKNQPFPNAVVKTTCPRDCYDACGMLATVQAGRVRKVRGDPNHHRAQGVLCSKCALAYNGVWLNESRRLTQPLRRSGMKGNATFTSVSWEEALSEIASRLHAVIDASSAHTVLHTHYTGTCSLLAGNFPIRFFNRLGATEVDPDTVCNKAGHEALRIMFGSSIFGFDPRSVEDSECLIVWGANPSVSAPHVHKTWLNGIKGHAKLIVIDPIRHKTAELADLHLQLRPGTDALLAFAIVHVLQRNMAINDDFIARHVEGWNEIKDVVTNLNLDDAACRTGLSREHIEQVAHWYGTGKSLLWIGQGVQRQARGGNVVRSIGLLPAVTGNIGRIGTGFLYMNAPLARGVNMDWLNATQLRQASNHPSMVSHMDLASILEDASHSRALFTWNNNIAVSSPEQHRLREALKREDLLHIALDIFPTDTTAYADFVLPAASFLEFDDVLLSYFDYTISAQVKAAQPMGASMSNQDIFRHLARAMGFEDKPLFESDDALIAQLLAQIKCSLSFNELAAKGTIAWRDTKVNCFENGIFPTPSGKIEIASEQWEAAGMPRAPQPWADELPKDSRLRVLSPADKWLINSSYANDSLIANKLGPQTLRIHPFEAARRSLKNGQQVLVSNEIGALEVTLAFDDTVPKGVGLLPKGRWPSSEGSGANVNVLNTGQKSDLGESSSVHSTTAEILSV